MHQLLQRRKSLLKVIGTRYFVYPLSLLFLLFITNGFSQQVNSSSNHTINLKNIQNQMQDIEDRTTSIDKLTLDQQSRLSLDSHKLHSLLLNPSQFDKKTGIIIECINAAEALANFIDNSIQAKIQTRQDWEDYKTNKKICLSNKT